MTFLDKILRWKKKPFGDSNQGAKGIKGVKTMNTADASVSAEVSEKGTGAFAHILMAPHLSEKAVAIGQDRQYVFQVIPSATKHEVARAIRDIYGIIPEAVRIIRVRGKQLRFGSTTGTSKMWKKAMVKLPVGKSIDVYKK